MNPSPNHARRRVIASSKLIPFRAETVQQQTVYGNVGIGSFELLAGAVIEPE
jgi:hypothetical protein